MRRGAQTALYAYSDSLKCGMFNCMLTNARFTGGVGKGVEPPGCMKEFAVVRILESLDNKREIISVCFVPSEMSRNT